MYLAYYRIGERIMKYKYKRILLKLSGEAMAEKKDGEIVNPFDVAFLADIAKVVGELVENGVQVGIVTGGGNVFRGASAKEFTRARADDMGMLVTMLNSLAVENQLNRAGVKAVTLSAVEMNKVAQLFTKERAEEYFGKGYVVVFGGGTGNPYFSTDTAAVLRACEINADAVFLAKNVDAVYSADPRKDPDAVRYTEISCHQVVDDMLGAIDLTASMIALNAKMPMELFSLKNLENILKAARGESAGTTITAE